MERHRLALLTALAVLAVPATAEAAPVKIGPKPSSTSATRITVDVANPNRYAMRGSATVIAGNGNAADRTVKLRKRSVTSVAFRFGADGLEALRASGGRATIRLDVRGGKRRFVAKRTMLLHLAAGGGSTPAPAPGGGSTPAPGGGATQPAPTNKWAGRMGTEGAYDDLEFTLINGEIQITKTPLVPVYCFEMGGSYRTALSFEPFVVTGPWAAGSDGSVQQSGIAVNQLVSGGSRGITYTMKEVSTSAGTVTGKLGMSFFDSKYDIFTNKIWFVNCSGSQSFEAIPAA